MLRVLLFPFAVLYDLVTRVRNYLFDIGHKPSFRFDAWVISVGNLNVGGSGKTPMIEYLVRLFDGREPVAILSRGYGRTTSGLKFAASDDTALTLGDEPFQLWKKFEGKAKVVVAEDRAYAIPNLLHEHGEVKVILLDDAFQHRAVRPQFSILLTEYTRPFTRDFVLPAGRLREARVGARRADVVVVTKCPDYIVHKPQLISEIRRYIGNKPVFFSRTAYGEPVSFGDSSSEFNSRVVLVTGIADAGPLESYAGDKFNLVRHFRFGDHHSFSANELQRAVEVAGKEGCCLLTTEKDMARIVGRRFGDLVARSPWFYIPIELTFIKNGSEFDELVLRSNKPE